MDAGESSWSRWTSTSAVEERGEIGIFGNKKFFKKKRRKEAGPPARRQSRSPQAGPQPAGGAPQFRRQAYPARRSANPACRRGHRPAGEAAGP